jgi:hypothetical protein
VAHFHQYFQLVVEKRVDKDHKNGGQVVEGDKSERGNLMWIRNVNIEQRDADAQVKRGGQEQSGPHHGVEHLEDARVLASGWAPGYIPLEDSVLGACDTQDELTDVDKR